MPGLKCTASLYTTVINVGSYIGMCIIILTEDVCNKLASKYLKISACVTSTGKGIINSTTVYKLLLLKYGINKIIKTCLVDISYLLTAIGILAIACTVNVMNVAGANITCTVKILIGMGAITILHINVRTGSFLPVVSIGDCPLILIGVSMLYIIFTNIAKPVFVSINVISKFCSFGLSVLAGCGMPMLCSITVPLIAKGMFTTFVTQSQNKHNRYNYSDRTGCYTYNSCKRKFVFRMFI